MQTENLFVYGRLMSNQNNLMSSYLNNNTHFIGEGFIFGRLYDLGKYPGFIPSNNPDEKVFGEIYELTNAAEIFKVVDDFEESWPLYSEDSEYKRIIFPVFYNNNILKCWVYVYNWTVDENKQIKSGKFV
jgi:gamma-glutamylcyclotransferase (GGCT)/AIG2-like uncharacterized protein YtfP